MNNVIVRAISGAVYVLLIIGAIFIGPTAFIILTALFACLALAEFNQIAHINEPVGDKSSSILAIDLAGVLVITTVPAIVFRSGWGVFTTISVISLYILARAIVALYDKRSTAYLEVAKSVLGVMYIAVPLMALNVLYIYDIENTRWLVLMMFVMIWLNDTGAFLFGSKFGKNRLFERLSPKKSWEGFWGGMLCCVVCGLLCSWLMHLPPFNILSWIILSVLICAFATWGDLFESMLKRTVKVKDSGNIIPGHGGILDRIDSLLFVAPVTFMVFYLANLLH